MIEGLAVISGSRVEEDVSAIFLRRMGEVLGSMNPPPWFEFAPRSEQEVVTLFGLLLPKLPERFIINEVREAFPDCLAGSSELRVESWTM